MKNWEKLNDLGRQRRRNFVATAVLEGCKLKDFPHFDGFEVVEIKETAFHPPESFGGVDRRPGRKTLVGGLESLPDGAF